MAIKEDLETNIAVMLRSSWTERDGTVVPEPESIKLGNDGVKLDAVCLYADMAQSTALVNARSARFAAEMYKAFLLCASRLIKEESGTITSFDGDRVMGIFIGINKNTRAVRCAMKIHYAVANLINPAIRKQYPTVDYTMRHAVGVDSSEILAARTGVRGANDIVWVGRAANYAAKLCDLRDGNYATWITEAVYNTMGDEVKLGGNPKQSMWEKRLWTPMNNAPIYRSSFWWSI
ncbi:adenylate/guanylate cyclase domain-containing protein [Dongia sp.]|uniref:adenylate/guanylate cyclase domain-containing protein n=1 Tax=Dongia sp. TaxID=1977262 RepID=UPI0035B11580